MTRVFHGLDEFRDAAGEDLGHGSWLRMDQERIDGFADLTEDWQWIHVDRSRAEASDLGATIAHGYLVLSLVPRLSAEVFTFSGVGRAVNYGLDRVRFPASVHPGDQIRAAVRLTAVEDRASGVLGRVRYTIEIRRRERPACVLDAAMLLTP